MDIEMPLMDGIEATRCICNGGATAGVIALSGTEYQERALAIRDAGAADYIQKSRYADELLDAIVALSADNGSRSRASTPTTSAVDALRARAAQTPVAANQAPVRNPRQAADRATANCRSTKRPHTTTRGD